eukprot:scaffold1995_cov167-Amphora_coffeaeformis.AAC.1
MTSTTSSPILGKWHSPNENVESLGELVNNSSTTSSHILGGWQSRTSQVEQPEKPTNLQAAMVDTESSRIIDGFHSPDGSIESPDAFTNTETPPQAGGTFLDVPRTRSAEVLSIPSLYSPAYLLKLTEVLTPRPLQAETPPSATGRTPYRCWVDQPNPDLPSLIGITNSFTPNRSVVAAIANISLTNSCDMKLESSSIQGEPGKICHISEDDVYSKKNLHNSRGNLHYARLVKLHAPDYAMTSHEQKKSIIKGVVSAVIQRGGRFLKSSTDGFVCMSKKATHTKVATALRSAASKHKKPKGALCANESMSLVTQSPTTRTPTSTEASGNSHVGSYEPGIDPKQQGIVASVSLSPGREGVQSDVLEPANLDMDTQDLSIEPMDAL